MSKYRRVQIFQLITDVLVSKYGFAQFLQLISGVLCPNMDRFRFYNKYQVCSPNMD